MKWRTIHCREKGPIPRIVNSSQDKPRWWRPRWSVRTLVIVLSVVCCYAACWEPTKHSGVADLAYDYELKDEIVARLGPVGIFHTFALAPLIVCQDENFGDIATRRYYFWLFGCVTKLPFEREVKVLSVPPDSDYVVDNNVLQLVPQESASDNTIHREAEDEAADEP